MHVTIHHLTLGLMTVILSLATLTQIAVPALAQPTPVMWRVPMDEAWGYGVSWYWNPSTNRINGNLVPQIIVESITDGVITARIAGPNGHTLPLYGDDSRIIVKYGYDNAASSPPFFIVPTKGEFSIKIPDSYLDADYVTFWVNSHSFEVRPSSAYPENGTSTVTIGPTNKMSTSTFVTEEGLEGTLEILVTEKSTTTTKINADEESVVRIITTKSSVTETTTLTTPKSPDQMHTIEETTSESSTTLNSRSTTSTSADGRITTVTNVASTIFTKIEETLSDESITKITTVTTNSTKVVTETTSLAYETDLITIWDNHKHFKIDGYFMFEEEYWENTSYEGWLVVAVNGIKTEYRLAQ